MKILTSWLRSYLPALSVHDAQLAEDLTLRGIAVEGVFPAEHTTGSLFDMDITTNRVDAMNHYGIAREAAAIYNVPLPALDTTLPAATPAAPFPVHIAEPTLCGRFTAQVIRGVTIAPSQGRVSEYFNALGQKPISDAVDATNFVLLGMGHPTHAFDLDKIQGGITVRRAHAGEQIRLLDGTTRTLVAEDLVIADDTKAISLAGVMGGWDTMITAETKNVLVEAAWFEPATIRASSRRHLIHTDASHRFERGADFAAAPVANALVTRTILAACGGTLEGTLVDIVIPGHEQATASRPALAVSLEQVQRILGTTLAPEGITAALVAQYLTALGCTLQTTSTEGRPATWNVTLPSWRLDLTREIDLIEEVARVYGYNRFANTLPTPAEVIPHPTARAEKAVRTRLFELGFSEAISSTFQTHSENALFAPERTPVSLENPLNSDAENLRSSLLPGMVTMLAHNLTRDVLHVRLFEAGAIFNGINDEVAENLSLSLGLTGDPAWTPPYALEAPLFFELKGALESITSLFQTPPANVSAESLPAAFASGRAANLFIAGNLVASFGQLSNSESTRRKLRQPIHIAELNLAKLLRFPLKHPISQEISRFQAVERDFSFTFPDAILWSKIDSAIRALNLADLRSLSVIEVWRDRKKNPGVFSILIRTNFQSNERTLVDTELADWSTTIISTLQALGGTLRA